MKIKKTIISKIERLKQWILHIVISRFIPDYYELRKENKSLKVDIYNLIKHENEEEGLSVKIRWNFVFNMDASIWFGDTSDRMPTGFFSKISNN